MKTIILGLVLFLGLGLTQETKAQSKYRVTAQTEMSYGQNYWVDLIVEANSSSYSNYIRGVYYNDGTGLRYVSHSKVYGYENKYQVTIDWKTYYFNF